MSKIMAWNNNKNVRIGCLDNGIKTAVVAKVQKYISIVSIILKFLLLCVYKTCTLLCSIFSHAVHEQSTNFPVPVLIFMRQNTDNWLPFGKEKTSLQHGFNIITISLLMPAFSASNLPRSLCNPTLLRMCHEKMLVFITKMFWY